MTEITLDNAPAPVKNLYNRGFAAMERGNLDYAIDMFSSCVEMAPTFHRARKLLRAAEIRKLKHKNTQLNHFCSTLSGIPLLLKGMAQIKSGKALDALKTSEKLLRSDPLNMTFIKMNGEAAIAAKIPEAAIESLALVREHYPKDIDLLNWLGMLYMENKQTDLGRQCFETVVTLRPNDAAALKALKDAMAIHSMAKDGWSDAATKGNFREAIKNEKEAAILEQESKAVKGDKDVEALISENKAKIQKEPGNINYRRALANLYSSHKRYDEAMAILEDAQKLVAGRDPQIDSMIATLRVQQFDEEIEKLTSAGNQEAAEKLAEERTTFLFENVKDRASRYPNDLQIRYDYGTQLFERGMVNEAIQQFQVAQRHPQLRIQVLYHIGMCFELKKQYDLALQQFDTAISEHHPMDDLKKNLLYQAGLVLESMGNRKKALENFKRIYQVDISFKDITERIEKGYSAENA